MPVSRDEIVWCYRAILGREPESEGAVLTHLKEPDFSSLRETFLCSAEFSRDRIASSSTHPLGGSDSLTFRLDLPKNEIEHRATATQLADSIAKIKVAWSHLGITSPHFSVLTDEQYLPQNLPENLETFWASGAADADAVERILVRHDFSSLSTKTCVEFGSGVGRVTMELARRFAQVHAYDISPGHLSQAAKRAEEIGVSNCIFHLCGETYLDELEKCDFFFSLIVLQHNPPQIIAQLIRKALRSLNADGIAIFQVPTYQVGYQYTIREWLATDHPLNMQMHCLPQNVIFSICGEEDCIPLEVREDNRAGPPNHFISNTFVVRKQSARLIV